MKDELYINDVVAYEKFVTAEIIKDSHEIYFLIDEADVVKCSPDVFCILWNAFEDHIHVDKYNNLKDNRYWRQDFNYFEQNECIGTILSKAVLVRDERLEEKTIRIHKLNKISTVETVHVLRFVETDKEETE